MSYRGPATGRNYDLRMASDQKEVKRLVRRDCPLVIVVSPPCTAFSRSRELRSWHREQPGSSVAMSALRSVFCF